MVRPRVGLCRSEPVDCGRSKTNTTATAIVCSWPWPQPSMWSGCSIRAPTSISHPRSSGRWSTYVDIDRRAGQFFGDQIGVQELLVEHGVGPNSHSVRFISADYTDLLDLDDGEFDLLISLYAGFVSRSLHARDLRVGGTLLVNPSHGDAAMASIDPRYRLHAVVTSRSGNYAVETRDLDSYLVPKRDVEVTKESLHDSGRGIAYTKSPFAYLFERVA